MNEGREMKIYEERVTPLIWAIDRGDIAEVGALLEEGADPNQPGEYGSVPLSVAARKDDQTFMKILLEKGANVNGDINNGDDWPLLSAASYAIHNDEDWDNYYFLIKSGANINSLYGTGNSGDSALNYCSLGVTVRIPVTIASSPKIILLRCILRN
jgi:hypothetical protein